MRLLVLFYPWLELLSLIQLGIETSALFALLWVIAMFLLGAAMLRHVGMASLARLQEAQRSGVLQRTFFVDDLAVGIAALLLMIPGVLSDFFALVVLVGPLRRRLAGLIFGAPDRSAADWPDAGDADGQMRGTRRNANPKTLEGDFHDISEDTRRRDS